MKLNKEELRRRIDALGIEISYMNLYKEVLDVSRGPLYEFNTNLDRWLFTRMYPPNSPGRKGFVKNETFRDPAEIAEFIKNKLEKLEWKTPCEVCSKEYDVIYLMYNDWRCPSCETH